MRCLHFLRRAPVAALAFVVTCATAALAQDGAPAPGDYVSKGGYGNLQIRRDGGFSIESVGGNGHTCELEGRLNGWVGAASSDDDESAACTVTFSRLPGGVRVKAAAGEACRSFCGMRATFDGDYLAPQKGCADAERKKTRADFTTLYRAKRYAEAAARLEPLLSSCADQIDRFEDRALRNDLAVTQRHLGDAAGCLATLAPISADAARRDEELRGLYPPTDFESMMPLIRATRTNLKLCGG